MTMMTNDYDELKMKWDCFGDAWSFKSYPIQLDHNMHH